MITADGRAIAKVYERMIGLAATYTDAPIANNTTFQLDFPFDFRQDIARVDYRPSRDALLLHAVPARQVRPDRAAWHVHRLRDADHSDQPRRPGYGIQLSHTWIAGRTCSTTSR